MSIFSSHIRWTIYGLFILLSSCVSMGKISVQVSVPPPRAIPSEIQSIVLMNRSMTSSFANLDQDSLENIFVRKKLALNELLLDSAAADTTLKAIGNALYESGRFDVVIPLKRNLPNNSSSYLTKLPSLTLPQVKQICTEFNADAMLSLDTFFENVNTSYRIGYDPMSEYGNAKVYTIFVQIAYHSNWKLYQPGEKLKIANFEVKDTIFWEQSGNTLQQTYEKLPTIKETLLNGAIENGRGLAAYISPGLKEEGRSYYITGKKEADEAIVLLNNNKWKEAEEVWMKFYSANPSTLRSQLEFNLALASEMNGQLNEALEWAEKSYKTKYTKASEDYIRLLKSHLSSN